MKYLWGGRFTEGLAEEVKDFTFSLAVDKKLARYDVAGSIAHARMLGKCGIISRPESARLVKGLERIARELAGGTFGFAESDEDIHTAIERRLIEIVGRAGGKLHTARSRNDQIALDERLYLRDAVRELDAGLAALQKALVSAAAKTPSVVMPEYTHLQHGQPVLLAHHLLAYVEMLQRDKGRLAGAAERTDELPLGAAACCGTSLPIDREYVARELGFARVSRNSVDTVSDRDFMIEMAAVCAIIMVHLSRLAEEFIIWNTEEFKFLELPDAFCTGSSLMPQKKNPDVLELVRGKAAVVTADLNGLLVLLKGLPLAYNRDMQEDKKFVFEAVETTSASLRVLARLIPGVVFNQARMKDQAGRGFLLATDVAEYLVAKGMPFRQAHGLCGRIVNYCLDQGKTLEILTLAEYRKFSPVFAGDIFNRLTLAAAVNARRSTGGTAAAGVKKELERWKKALK